MLHDVPQLLSCESLQVMVLRVRQQHCIAMQCPTGSRHKQNSGSRTKALCAEEVRDAV